MGCFKDHLTIMASDRGWFLVCLNTCLRPQGGWEHKGRCVTYPNATSNEAFELVLPALVSNFLQRGVQKLAVKLVQRVFLYFWDLLHNRSDLQVPGTLRSEDKPTEWNRFEPCHTHSSDITSSLAAARLSGSGCGGGAVAVLPHSPAPRRSGKPGAPGKPCSRRAAHASASPSARC